MTLSPQELIDRLAAVEDPSIGEDIVSLGLINDIEIEDGTADISLAFNAPFAPAEMEIGAEIRDVISAAGLEPNLRANVSGDLGFDDEVLPQVRNVIAVSSAKGGVGKTTIAANLAAGLDKLGANVGILDADIHGPNVPEILPPENEPGVTPSEELVPPKSDGVRIISMGFLTEDDDPAILRGPMVNKFMMQFLDGVVWGRLDYLVVDLPPGTGDASLNLLQSMPVTGAVIVTTPQQMAIADTRKGIRMFQDHNTPVVGVVENMSSFRCPGCGDEHALLGSEAGVEDIVSDFDVPVLGSLPMHSDFGVDGTGGTVVKDDESDIQGDVESIVEAIADRTGEINRRTVAEHRAPDDTEPTDDTESAPEPTDDTESADDTVSTESDD